MVGRGCPDILVGCSGANLLVEIKDGALPLSARQLTKDEHRWHVAWLGHVCVIKDTKEVIELVAMTRGCLFSFSERER